MSEFNSQVMSMGIIFSTWQLTKDMEFETQLSKQIVLGSFFLAQTIFLAISYHIDRKITKRKDKTVLEYTEQARPFSGQEPKQITTTHMAYDLEQNAHSRQVAAIGVAALVLAHYQFGMVRPLVVQAILPIKNVLTSKLAKIHLWGKPAEGDLVRPWLDESITIFNNLMKAKPKTKKAKTGKVSNRKFKPKNVLNKKEM